MNEEMWSGAEQHAEPGTAAQSAGVRPFVRYVVWVLGCCATVSACGGQGAEPANHRDPNQIEAGTPAEAGVASDFDLAPDDTDTREASGPRTPELDDTSNEAGVPRVTDSRPKQNGATSPPAFEDCASFGDTVGRAELRRLTRLQYQRTLRDLLGQSIEEEVFSGGEYRLVDTIQEFPVASSEASEYRRIAQLLARRLVLHLSDFIDCDPEQASCAEQFIHDLGARAHRRPLSREQEADYLGLFELARDDYGSAAEGLRVVVETLLQSPYFLYQVDVTESGASEDFEVVDGYSLASRLSYFLWGTMPDAQLFDAAAWGVLPAELTVEVARLLADPRARDGVADFTERWLPLGVLPGLVESAEGDSPLDTELVEQMQDEMNAFVAGTVLDPDSSFAELLLSPRSPAAPRLLETVYGTSAADSGWTELDGDERAGLLTRAGFLGAHSFAYETSPTRRGKWVQDRLLCQVVPPPPDSVPALTDLGLEAPYTKREFLEAILARPNCFGCHQLMDPIGFAFESYDPIGIYRTTDEQGLAIDPSGYVWRLDGQDAAFTNAIELSSLLAESPTAHACAATQWFRFAVGREDTPADQGTIRELGRRFLEMNGNFTGLLKCIVHTPQFVGARKEGYP